MARIGLVTSAATYQGELDLRAPGGQPVRLLDALNTPHRLVQGSSTAVSSVLLHEAMRRDDATGTVTPCGNSVALRAGAILAAYEILTEQVVREARAGAVYEQRRHAQESARVAIYLLNGWRVEGTISGGLATLDATRPGRGDFVACLDAQILDPRRQSARTLPFVAINIRHVEGGALLGTAGPGAAG